MEAGLKGWPGIWRNLKGFKTAPDSARKTRAVISQPAVLEDLGSPVQAMGIQIRGPGEQD